MTNTERPGALEDIRVLDLTDALGVYCAKLLADLGADVIKVEPPQGAPGRRRGPFHHDGPHPDGSLWFIHFNAGKRGVTLDLDTLEGQALLKRLAAVADVLVEDAAPGVMADRGLGYHDLSRLNPHLVYTSVTPYGQAGPYSGYAGSDLTAQAMGGLMYRVGWPEDPPSSLGASFAYQHTAAIAAVGTLMALVGRDASGQGQHVDAAMHDSIAMVQYDAMPRHAATGQAIRRAGPGQGVGGRRNTRIWPCGDGHVRFQLLGATAVPEWPRLLDWLDEHGMAEDLRDPPVGGDGGPPAGPGPRGGRGGPLLPDPHPPPSHGRGAEQGDHGHGLQHRRRPALGPPAAPRRLLRIRGVPADGRGPHGRRRPLPLVGDPVAHPPPAAAAWERATGSSSAASWGFPGRRSRSCIRRESCNRHE